MTVRTSEPIFAVRDIQRSIAFYRDVLGFERPWAYRDPPVHGGISIGSFQLMFTLAPTDLEPIVAAEHFFRVDDVAQWHDLHRERGAPIVEALGNRPWGMAEYTVQDPDGHRLRFAGEAMYERSPQATTSLPAHYRIAVGTPPLEDFARLHDEVGWARPSDASVLPEALARSAFCVTAVDDRSGETIGLLRIVGDGKAYTIWDVMVRPANQGQRVGSEMIRVALGHLRTLAPAGTFVGLFSGKPAFYERLGFTRDGGLHLPL